MKGFSNTLPLQVIRGVRRFSLYDVACHSFLCVIPSFPHHRLLMNLLYEFLSSEGMAFFKQYMYLRM